MPPAVPLLIDDRPPMRVGVLVVAYNAATTLAQTLDRLPPSFAETSTTSSSATTPAQTRPTTWRCATSSAPDLPLTVVQHPENLGYGGNQKSGYHWAIDHGLDVVVLLHGDGQYAPEVIESTSSNRSCAARRTPCSAPG